VIPGRLCCALPVRAEPFHLHRHSDSLQANRLSKQDFDGFLHSPRYDLERSGQSWPAGYRVEAAPRGEPPLQEHPTRTFRAPLTECALVTRCQGQICLANGV